MTRRRIARIVIAIALFVATFFAVRWWDFALPTVGRAPYQAVFLTNGQAYFGHYVERLGPYIKIEDPYYIQQTQASGDQTQTQQKLVRRGSELHQPSGAMLIPKSSILFVEDLRSDSQFAQFMDKDLGR